MGKTQIDSTTPKAGRYCTVGYSRSGGMEDVCIGDVILIGLERPVEHRVQLRERPDWRDLVSAEDRVLVVSVLADIAERALVEPQAVFKQLSELSAGPLITHKTGPELSLDPELAAIYDRFTDLQG